MINKEHLWFITLFSLILVLCVYYITMPSDLLLSSQAFNEREKENENVSLEIVESDVLTSLRLDLDEERKLEKKDLESILTDTSASVDEKNQAYEKINYLNNIYGTESKLEKQIKDCCNIDTFVELDNDEIKVIGVSSNHSVELANNIMRTIQDNFNERVVVTVSFK